MPRAEAGSAKAIGNAIKARGLTQLRFYCQICQKANRDANAYKMHTESESHMRQIAALGSNPNKVINDNSRAFQDEFVTLLSRRFGTARVNANRVYQEHIADRHHLHMNATRWVSLSEFVKHLGREGICQVEEIPDEGQHGWYITWIDNSPAALARQDALQKLERSKMDEEGRMRRYLKEQIERAKEQESKHASTSQAPKEEGLKRDEGSGPLKIGISLGGASGASKEAATASNASTSSSAAASSSAAPSAAPAKIALNPLKPKSVFSTASSSAATKPNPLKGANSNPLRGATSSSSSRSTPVSASSSRSSAMTAAERIMAEEQERKRKMSGPMPSANVKRSRF